MEDFLRIDHVTHLSVHFVMVRISSVAYSITGPQGIKFTLTIGKRLVLTFNIPRTYCQNSTGLLGSCKESRINSTELVENTVRGLISSSKVIQNDTLFQYDYLHYHEHRLVTGGGFCLRFIDSFVVSKPLVIPRVHVITLELLVRIRSYGGVILAFVKDNTFAVINDETLRISYRHRVFDTSVVMEIRQWYQISLVFYQLIGKVEIYIFDRVRNLSIRVFMLDREVLASGGSLAFGQWLTSNNPTQPPSSIFDGDIDEVTMWRRRSNPNIVKRNEKLNVQPGAYPDLLHLWKFDEVEGSVVKDEAGDDDLYLKRFHEPERAFSDADIPAVNPDEDKDITKTIDPRDALFCRSVLLEGSLHDNCLKLGEPTVQSYYNTCLYDVSLSGRNNSAVDAVIAFADFCQQVLELVEWPARQLCNLFPGKRFPNWIGSDCEKKCVFGYPITEPNSTGSVACKCEKGYWGASCSGLCPGGLWNVCNERGQCDAVNGQCTCSAKWNGTMQDESASLSETTLFHLHPMVGQERIVRLLWRHLSLRDNHSCQSTLATPTLRPSTV